MCRFRLEHSGIRNKGEAAALCDTFILIAAHHLSVSVNYGARLRLVELASQCFTDSVKSRFTFAVSAGFLTVFRV
jgi:hypothetical protein